MQCVMDLDRQRLTLISPAPPAPRPPDRPPTRQWKQLGWPEIVLLFTLFAAGIFVTICGTITGVQAIVANSATYQLFR